MNDWQERAWNRATFVLFVAFCISLIVSAWMQGHPARAALWFCVTIGGAGVLHAVRCVIAARYVRCPPKVYDCTCIFLVLLPASLLGTRPVAGLAIMAIAFCLYFGYLAFREAFSSNVSGGLSPRGFVVCLAGLAVGIVAARLLNGLLMRDAALPWFALVRNLDASQATFNHMFDFVLILCVPVLLSVEDRSAPGWAWTIRLCGGVAVVGVVLSFCRAAWVALALEGMLVIVLTGDRRWRWTLCAAGTALVLVALGVPGIWQRVGSIFDTAQQTNIERVEQWAAALRLVSTSPLVGHGPGSFGPLYAGMGGAFSAHGYPCPHSLYLHIAAECGLPALAVFLGWVVCVLRRLWQGRNNVVCGVLACGLLHAGIGTVGGLLAFGLFDM